MFLVFGVDQEKGVPHYDDHKKIWHPDDWELFDRSVAYCITKGKSYNIVVRIIFPILPAALALAAQKNGWGLMNWLNFPHGIEVLLSIMLMDMAIYTQHLIFHSMPVLWKLHLVHHLDLDGCRQVLPDHGGGEPDMGGYLTPVFSDRVRFFREVHGKAYQHG